MAFVLCLILSRCPVRPSPRCRWIARKSSMLRERGLPRVVRFERESISLPCLWDCVPTGTRSSAANPSKSLFDRARPLKSSSYQILSEERARRIARQIAGFRPIVVGHFRKISASCPVVSIDFIQYHARCLNIREAINRKRHLKWTRLL